MKIRSGFVSNSSSSSFVMLVIKDEFDKVRDSKDPLRQAIIDATMDQVNIFGNECMMHSDYSSNGGCGPCDYTDTNAIMENAIQLANEQGCDICSEEDFPTDLDEQRDYLRDIIRDLLCSTKYYFKDVPKDKKWSHSQDW